jgi:hypothetical protein
MVKWGAQLQKKPPAVVTAATSQGLKSTAIRSSIAEKRQPSYPKLSRVRGEGPNTSAGGTLLVGVCRDTGRGPAQDQKSARRDPQVASSGAGCNLASLQKEEDIWRCDKNFFLLAHDNASARVCPARARDRLALCAWRGGCCACGPDFASRLKDRARDRGGQDPAGSQPQG